MAERGMADAPIVEVDDLAKSYRTAERARSPCCAASR